MTGVFWPIAPSVGRGMGVFRIGQDIRNVDDSALQRGTADETVSSGRDRVLPEEILIFPRETGTGGTTKAPVLPEKNLGVVHIA